MLWGGTREMLCIFDTYHYKNFACAVLPSAGNGPQSFTSPIVEHAGEVHLLLEVSFKGSDLSAHSQLS